eukprot:SAG11_NODE_12583_length_696_cov_0.685092_1_plen_44_part_00
MLFKAESTDPDTTLSVRFNLVKNLDRENREQSVSMHLNLYSLD